MKKKNYYLVYKDKYDRIHCHPIGLALKLMRKYNNMSLSYAASSLNIHRNTLSKYEHEESNIPLVAFVELAKLYNMSVMDLYNEQDMLDIRININRRM